MVRMVTGNSGNSGGGWEMKDEGQKAPKKFPTEKGKRKIYVLQGRIINNTAAGECRKEQWHCVEKRWRILLSFLSETALSINYFYVFIHYFIAFHWPDWF